MIERYMTRGTLDQLQARKKEIETSISAMGSESSGTQRATLYDDPNTETQLNLLRAELAKFGDLFTVSIIEPAANPEHVGLGTRVVIEFEDGTDEVTILGPDDVIYRKDLGTVISPECPLGRTIMGKGKSEALEMRLSYTQKSKVKIVNILPGVF